jgi:putative aldouronate transport system permease protein
MRSKNPNKIRQSRGDRIFNVVNIIIIVLLLVVFLYPMVYVISTSVSVGEKLVKEGSVNILPRGFSLEAYKKIFNYKGIGMYFYNTVFYAVVSTVVILFVSVITAWPLAHPNMPFRKTIMTIFTITMFFGGGLIPYYILIKNINLMNTRWVAVIPYALNVWNVIVFKTFFTGLPKEMEESARIDGANDITILFRIIVPLSKPIIATFAIFSMVASWNDYFTPLVYMRDINLHPIQLLLRKLLVQADMTEFYVGDVGAIQLDARPLRCAAIVVSSLPILTVYPFFQKYFAKGVIVGSIKG